MSEPFTETDLLRFFNSLCETEASLREATHPRYVLEIGLIKLIDMRSVVSVETLLERLQALAAGTPHSPEPIGRATSASAGPVEPVPEKKNSKI